MISNRAPIFDNNWKLATITTSSTTYVEWGRYTLSLPQPMSGILYVAGSTYASEPSDVNSNAHYIQLHAYTSAGSVFPFSTRVDNPPTTNKIAQLTIGWTVSIPTTTHITLLLEIRNAVTGSTKVLGGSGLLTAVNDWFKPHIAFYPN